jgi:hypothetical protein
MGGYRGFRALSPRCGICPDRRVLGGVLGTEDLRFDLLDLLLGELGALLIGRGARPAGVRRSRPQRQSTGE